MVIRGRVRIPCGTKHNVSTTEKVSATHQAIFTPKSRTRNVELVQLSTQLAERTTRVTDYIENGGGAGK